MRKLPSLHLLAAFEAVARHRSVTKAAEELSITKSAVSHRIKLLEARFDVSLFTRTSAGATLTPEGEFYLTAVREALGTLELAWEQMPRERRRVVRLSVRPAFASNWLVGRLSDFHRQRDDIDIEIYASKKADIRDVGADIAICYGKADEWPEYECKELLEGYLVPVCSPDYLRKLGSLDDPADLLRKGLLLRLPRHPWEKWFAAVGLKCREPITGPLFSDAHLMLCAASTGQGVALSFDALAEAEIRMGRLIKLFEPKVRSDYAYFALCSRSSLPRKEVAVFLDWLVAIAHKDVS